MYFFSVIIVTYNSAEVIVSCLKSISKLLYNEVIVVDNASTDDTKEIIRSQYPQVTLLENEKNIGFASAVNQAFAISKGEYVLLLNPDAILEPNFFEKVNLFIQNYPQASVIGCKLVDTYDRHQPSSWKTPTLKTLFLESFLPYEFSLRLVTELPNTTREVAMVSGACMLVRREVFQRLGGFDERFFMFYEDADFCLRARQQGFKVFYTPDFHVVHHISKSFGDDLEKFFRLIYTSKILFFKKHNSFLYTFLARFIVLIGICIRIPVYLLVGVLLFNPKFMSLFRAHLFSLRWALKA